MYVNDSISFFLGDRSCALSLRSLLVLFEAGEAEEVTSLSSTEKIDWIGASAEMISLT